MKFYDFIEFPYYALIGAETEEKAFECYKEQVCDIDIDSDSRPVEMTEEEAKEKYFAIAKNDEEKKIVTDNFNEYMSDPEPFVLLIDGCLD